MSTIRNSTRCKISLIYIASANRLLFHDHHVLLVLLVGSISFYPDVSEFWNRTSPPVDPTAPNFHPVSSKYKDAELFGELTPQDTEMLCTSSGFVTETMTFYTITPDGMSVMCQVIHSAVG